MQNPKCLPLSRSGRGVSPEPDGGSGARAKSPTEDSLGMIPPSRPQNGSPKRSSTTSAIVEAFSPPWKTILEPLRRGYTAQGAVLDRQSRRPRKVQKRKGSDVNAASAVACVSLTLSLRLLQDELIPTPSRALRRPCPPSYNGECNTARLAVETCSGAAPSERRWDRVPSDASAWRLRNRHLALDLRHRVPLGRSGVPPNQGVRHVTAAAREIALGRRAP